MKKTVRIAIYILILFFGQFLFAPVSFAEDCSADADCGADAKCEGGFCMSADSSVTPAEDAGSSGGSSAGGSAGGDSDTLYTGVDQRCWTKADCETKAFGTFVGPNDETKGACKMEKDVSNNQIGFCLPTKQAKMGLNWGEAGGQKSTYTNIGDFIKWIYRYGIVVAGILAVMMIIKAGFDWIISGGNQEMVSSAHKKIGNALMGLFLVVMAYFILNLINPYLVNFRLPNIWMINEAGLVPPYCDLAKDKKFYFAKETLSEKFANQYTEGQQKGFKTYDDAKPACGWEYYVEGAGGLTCKGTYCEQKDNQNQMCVVDKCEKGQLSITYTMQDFVQAVKEAIPGPVGGAEAEFLDENVFVIYGVCKNDSKVMVGNKWEEWDGGSEMLNITVEPGSPFSVYHVILGGFDTAHSIDHWNCPGNYKLVGFLMKNEISEAMSLWWPNFTDANLIVGYNHKTGELKYGVWGKQVGTNDYIPLELLKASSIKAQEINVGSVFEDLSSNTGEEPKFGYPEDIKN